MINIKNRTFTTPECPKSTIRLFEFVSFFKEALFQFNSFFLLLYVQLASPIAQNVSFTDMFFLISMVLIGSKILAGFCWSISSHILETGRFKYGRFRTMTFVGSSLSTLFSFLTFFVAPLCGDGWAYVIAFLIFYTCSECVFSVNDIAYWSYVNKMTYDEGKRSKIMGVTNLSASLGSYLVAALSPAISAGNAKRNMTILLLVLLSCFFVVHIIYCIFMFERADDVSFDFKHNGKLFESIRILTHDRQVFLVILCYFLFFIAQDIIAGNTSSYFYYEFGYGGFGAAGLDGGLSGGSVSFGFLLCFGMSVSLASFLYPYIAKPLGKKKTILLGAGLLVVLYLLLFFFGMNRGNEITLFVLTALLGLSHGLVLMALNMNVIDIAEYYQAQTGKERSASIQAAKALAVKTANGIQTGIFYLFLSISPNLLDVNRQVAVLEAMNNRGELEGNVIESVNSYVRSFSDIEHSLAIYRSSLTLLPLVISLIAAVLAFFVYVSDERKYEGYVEKVRQDKQNKNQ